MDRVSDCMEKFIDITPGFISHWERHKEYWGDDERGLCIDLAAYSEFVCERLNDFSEEQRLSVFRMAEFLLLNGNDEVKDCVATCFLESICNKISADGSKNGLDAELVVPYLGEKSREYVRAWDEFTGIKTPGLW